MEFLRLACEDAKAIDDTMPNDSIIVSSMAMGMS